VCQTIEARASLYLLMPKVLDAVWHNRLQARKASVRVAPVSYRRTSFIPSSISAPLRHASRLSVVPGHGSTCHPLSTFALHMPLHSSGARLATFRSVVIHSLQYGSVHSLPTFVRHLRSTLQLRLCHGLCTIHTQPLLPDKGNAKASRNTVCRLRSFVAPGISLRVALRWWRFRQSFFSPRTSSFIRPAAPMQCLWIGQGSKRLYTHVLCT